MAEENETIPEQKPKSKKFFIILTIVFLILAVGIISAGWYFASKKEAKAKQDFEKQIQDLTKQIDEEKSKAEAAKKEEKKEEPKRVKALCASTLTQADQDSITTWKTYSKDNYSFKYPEDWTIDRESEGYVLMKDNYGTSFEFMVGEEASATISGYETEATKDIKIACQDATETFKIGLSGLEDYRLIVTEFTKDSIPYKINFNYKYTIGASISSDFVEGYELTLKLVVIN
ncbi:MAG: hypothetical protein M1355_03145 [Patescibacteria group bacterium]|nr:hypothetical protein [Patescibacteria group bacterium]